MDDLISRQQAIDALRNYLVEKRCPDDGTLTCRLIENEVINKLPSIQPERLKGKWIHQAKFSRVECDQCGKVFRNTFAPKNFCPKCGAKMERGEQE